MARKKVVFVIVEGPSDDDADEEKGCICIFKKI